MISQIRKLIQDKLISGVNIKTINGSDILGPGNLTVTGSGVPDGDKGDITVSSSGTVWTIDNNAVTNAKINDVDWSKVTGEPTTLGGYGISDTKANFNTACSDGDFLFVGDVTQYTNEDAQDAVGAMVDASLIYADATPRLSRAALTGAITANEGNNTTSLGSFTKAQLDTAVSDGVPLFVGDIIGLTDGDKGDITVSSSGTVWNIDAATVGVTELSATGTANNTTFLRGDNTWAAPTASPASGTLILLFNHEPDQTGTGNADPVTNKTYTVAANTYSKIMVEGEIEFENTANTAGNATFNIVFGGVTKRNTTLSSDPTGTGDIVQGGGAIKYAEAFTGGGVVKITTTTVANGTWTVQGFRVYGVI